MWRDSTQKQQSIPCKEIDPEEPASQRIVAAFHFPSEQKAATLVRGSFFSDSNQGKQTYARLAPRMHLTCPGKAPVTLTAIDHLREIVTSGALEVCRVMVGNRLSAGI